MKASDFLLSGLTTQLKSFLSDAGRSGGRWLHNLQDYVAALAPIAEANAAPALLGDETAKANLGYLADMALLEASRLAEDFTAHEQEQLKGLVTDVVTSFIGLAANVVAPGAGAVVTAAIGVAVGNGTGGVQVDSQGAEPRMELSPAEQDVVSGAISGT